jgi:hypothetical protein
VQGEGAPRLRVVNLDVIDRWLAAPERRNIGFVDTFTEELMAAFTIELNDIVDETLQESPRL